jgi:LysW-gamma-L-lysine carboxypeptidase
VNSSPTEYPPEFETLIGLVRHYSPTGQEGEAVSWLVRRMAELGFTKSYVDEVGNAIALMGEGERRGVLLGHIDTVPGEIPVRAEDGQLHGRGAVDAKGPLAAFVDSLAHVGPVPGWQLIVVGAVGEEGDSEGARHIAEWEPPEFVIVGEPSRWDRVTLGYKGSAETDITVRRPMQHSAAPGESAPEAALSVWQAVSAWAASINDGRERVFDRLVPSVRGWSSGDDGFESWATLRLGVRFPPELPPEAWYARLKELANGSEIAPASTATPAYVGDKNSPLTRAFLGAIRATGGNPSFVFKTGTADLNIVGPRWNCPAVSYGPGDSALDHTPEERLSLAEFSRSMLILQRVLRELTRGG